ncbi:hypothetical protein SCOR_14000 [Sulfidibacter corallicola]
MCWRRYAEAKWIRAMVLGLCLWLGWPAPAEDRPVIHFKDGATLPVHEEFPHVYWPHGVGESVIVARSPEHDAFFVAAAFKEANPHPNRVLDLLIQVMGIQRIQLEPIEEETRYLGKNPQIFRLKQDDRFRDYILGFASTKSGEGAVYFYMVGSEEDFYAKTSAFWHVVDHFQPALKQMDRQLEPKPWMVIAAILILVANTGILWYGFHQMAIARTMESSET